MSFAGGGCSTISNSFYYLCFDFDQLRTCYRGDLSFETFEKLPESLYEHKNTRIATSDRG